MFNKASELLELCDKKGKKISEIAAEREIIQTEIALEDLRDQVYEVYETMFTSATAGLEEDIISLSGMTGGNARKMEEYRRNNKTVSGDVSVEAMAKAFSTSEVNASMGRIVAAPTAGASGIMPSAMLTVKNRFDLDRDTLIDGLLNSAAIGEIIAKNATISGAEGGCQAECGAASSMAASAIVEMLGGSPQQCLHAASFALINILGLVCDPVAGLVEFPCALRNASGVNNALISADMALAGVKSLVPFDQVVESMYNVGQSMPSALRETALGGLAATEAGQELKDKYLKY